jgi:hypothetical protein
MLTLDTAELEQFLAMRPEIPKRGWFKLGPIDVYVRVYGDKIDLANCNLTDDKYAGIGVYRTFVGWLYTTGRVYGYKQVKHENVHNDNLVARHRRHGLKEVAVGYDGTPTFIKDLTEHT